MRLRHLARLVVVLACATALSSGTALAAPAITESGIRNPVAWGLKSFQWTRVYAKTDTPGAWAIIDVLSSKGVVRKLYDGPAASAGVRLWTPLWNGTDASGHYLPTGNYKYRVRIFKGAQTGTASGLMPVARNRFTVTTSFQAEFSRWLYAGFTRVYESCSLNPGGGPYVAVSLYLGADPVWQAPRTTLTKAPGASTFTASHSFTSAQRASM